ADGFSEFEIERLKVGHRNSQQFAEPLSRCNSVNSWSELILSSTVLGDVAGSLQRAEQAKGRGFGKFKPLRDFVHGKRVGIGLEKLQDLECLTDGARKVLVPTTRFFGVLCSQIALVLGFKHGNRASKGRPFNSN